ncbi:FMN-dependent NADH-azoreductase [Undibacterium sp.]|uniref:FMN-dependent NADH-azoreductase n=1 Tax=Undibacterium sp. TaxID=1914977 RepID=UPI00374DB735
MNILHITCSPRGKSAESYLLSQRVLAQLLEKNPHANIISRDLWADQLPHVDGNYAAALGGMRSISGEELNTGSLGMSEQLIVELENADYVVIGTPMHNFTVPSVLKAWIDHVVRIKRTFNATAEGKFGLLADRPVFIAAASGGHSMGERSRHPDFLEPYLRAILATIGLHDLTFFTVQGTAFGPEPLASAKLQADDAIAEYFGKVYS